MSKNKIWKAEGLRDGQAAGIGSVHATRPYVETALGCSRAPMASLTASRPLESVKMVAWQLHRRSGPFAAQRLAPTTDEATAALGLAAATMPFWAIAAVDCRTRVVLGMVFAREPEPSIATSCLQMVTCGEGLVVDAAGVAGGWVQRGIPEAIVIDSGALFSSSAFVAACRGHDISIKRNFAGPDVTHDVIERRLQATIAELLSKHPPLTSFTIVASALAPGAPDHLRMALARRIVGSYHDTPQNCLGGKTPLEMWKDDHQSGTVPLRPAVRNAPRQVEQEGWSAG